MTTRATPTADAASAARTARVSAAVAQLTELFASGDLPDRIAQTEIVRLEGDRNLPSAKWSLQNRLLMILHGTADARGFQQWRQVGRAPVKGSHAFHILGPSIVKKKEADAAGQEVERSILTGFHTIPVFRFEDTDGEPLVRPDYSPPELPILADVAAAWKIPIQWLPYEGRYRGFYQRSGSAEKIVLNTHDASVFWHELAHAAHMRVMAASGRQMVGGQNPAQEIVAETTAAVLCLLYGFEGYVWHSHQYIKGYGGKNPMRAMARVLGDVEKSLALILETHEAGSETVPA